MKKPEYRKGYTNISNDLMDNICKLPLNGTDIKVILCIFRYTAGVGRKSCKLSGSSIAKWENWNFPRKKLVILHRRNLLKIY